MNEKDYFPWLVFVLLFLFGFGSGFGVRHFIGQGTNQRLVNYANNLEESNKRLTELIDIERRENLVLKDQLEKSRELGRRLREEIERGLDDVTDLAGLNKKQRELVEAIGSTVDSVTSGIKKLGKSVDTPDHWGASSGWVPWFLHWLPVDE
jgi:hypothetical protein